MVQSYKAFFQFLLHIVGLISVKRKKTDVSTKTLISFNTERLGENLELASMEIYRTKRDESAKAFRFAIETARNIQILEVSRLKAPTTEDLAHHMGRLEAFSDLISFIDRSQDDEIFREKKKRLEPKATTSRTLRSRAQSSESVI